MGGGKIAYVSCDWRSFQKIAPAACYRGRGRSLIPAGTVSASKLTVLIPAHLSRTDGRGQRRCCCLDEGGSWAVCRWLQGRRSGRRATATLQGKATQSSRRCKRNQLCSAARGWRCHLRAGDACVAAGGLLVDVSETGDRFLDKAATTAHDHSIATNSQSPAPGPRRMTSPTGRPAAAIRTQWQRRKRRHGHKAEKKIVPSRQRTAGSAAAKPAHRCSVLATGACAGASRPTTRQANGQQPAGWGAIGAPSVSSCRRDGTVAAIDRTVCSNQSIHS